MVAYYNDNDAYPAQWLRNLIRAGQIASGDVDDRSISEVKPNEVEGYTQCHFFAGIGGWSYALRLADWPDDEPVWTGSCPCQPFSDAGKHSGTTDVRHLWPEWYRLIRECLPPVIFGEQVSSKAGLEWLDLVSHDLGQAGYEVGAFDLCAAGAGAPHLRQRLYFVAHTDRGRLQQRDERQRRVSIVGKNGSADKLADAEIAGQLRATQLEDDREDQRERRGLDPAERGEIPTVELGDAPIEGLEGGTCQRGYDEQEQPTAERASGFWSEIEWLECRDGKTRPTKPGIFPLAHGISGRVAKLRAIGNAIVPPLAAEFIRAYMEVRDAGDTTHIASRGA